MKKSKLLVLRARLSKATFCVPCVVYNRSIDFLVGVLYCFLLFVSDKPKNPTMDSRQEYRFGHSSSSPSHSPTKESLKNSER